MAKPKKIIARTLAWGSALLTLGTGIAIKVSNNFTPPLETQRETMPGGLGVLLDSDYSKIHPHAKKIRTEYGVSPEIVQQAYSASQDHTITKPPSGIDIFYNAYRPRSDAEIKKFLVTEVERAYALTIKPKDILNSKQLHQLEESEQPNFSSQLQSLNPQKPIGIFLYNQLKFSDVPKNVSAAIQDISNASRNNMIEKMHENYGNNIIVLG